jgi:hypothetical protein
MVEFDLNACVVCLTVLDVGLVLSLSCRLGVWTSL